MKQQLLCDRKQREAKEENEKENLPTSQQYTVHIFKVIKQQTALR